jgi:phosphopantothenoylcysteine decarboxylase/phosphopantothenate--cysteine ligase
MDLDMFAHPSTQHNLDLLRSYGNHIIEPTSGELASHLEGKGRMEEPDRIVAIIEEFFASQQALAKKKVMITAGPTYEKLDPVRFIGNYSSGKMGFAIAEACAQAGAEVVLIAGPVTLKTVHPAIKRIDVESADEMYDAAVEAFEDCDAAIMCAAVADYKPAVCCDKKMKRSADDLTLQLVPNRDIAAALGAKKRDNQCMVGFALETNDEEANAQSKLAKKNLDFVVLNSLQNPGAGFRHDTNRVTIIERNGNVTEYPCKLKSEVAADIVSVLAQYVNNK